MPRSITSRGAENGELPAPGAVRVFISYSHDSVTHKQRVFQLADQLREDGIDCEVDQYEEAPPEGWPAWMAGQLRRARYVLVVCTLTYHRRVTGAERAGVGLGARWEGSLITQDLYERGGRNDKFIPVVFDAADIDAIPDFLRHTTYYDLSDEGQQEKLYRRLTGQPEVVRRPIGSVRPLPTHEGASSMAATTSPRKSRSDKSPKSAVAGRAARDGMREREARSPASHDKLPSLALIKELSGPSFFIPLLSVQVRGNETTAVLQPTGGPERAFLENLGNRRFGLPSVDFVFGTTAMRSRLNSVERSFEAGTDRFTIVLGSDSEPTGSVMEVNTAGLSADDIAKLRARRILLDESLPVSPGRSSRGVGDDYMLEALVRGLQSPIQVERSPLPGLARELGVDDRAYFLAAAQLTAMLWLRLSGTVANVVELTMKFRGADELAVRFCGTRARAYTNKDPEVISVDGVCRLG